MAGAEIEKHFIARVSSKDKNTGEAKDDLYLGSRTCLLSDLVSGEDDIPVFGILREVDGLGQSMGEVMPDDSYGSIVVDATRGTLEFDKRIYDRIERDTFIQQSIILYSLQRDPGQVSSGGLEIEFSGRITNVSASVKDKTMTLTVRSDPLSNESPNYQITRANFADSSDAASGRFLPLVFGLTQLLGYFIKETSTAVSGGGILDVFIDYRNAYATNFYSATAIQSFVNGAITAIYTKDKVGDWGLVTLPQNTTDDTTAATQLRIGTAAPSGADGRQADTVEIASPFPSVGYIININRSEMCLSAAVTACKATFVHEVYAKDSAVQVPLEGVLVSGQSVFQLNINPATFQDIAVATYLSEAMFLHPDKAYYFVCRGSDSVVAVGTAVWKRRVLSTRQVRTPRRVDDTANSIRQWRREESDRSDHVYQLWVIGYRSRTQDQQYTFLDVRAYEPALFVDLNTPSLGFMTPPDLSAREFIFEANGLTDNSSGTITGGAGGAITRADHVIKFLWYMMNGYTLSGLDYTTFSPGDYAPDVNGASEGRQSYRDIMIEILENAAMKLVPRRGANSLALWAYGVHQETEAILTEADCTFEGFEIQGDDAIVNRVRVNYDKSAIPLQLANQQQSERNFRASLEMSSPDSIALYGTKDLASDFVQLNYITDEESAERYGDFKLSQYSTDRIYVTISVPFWKHDYRSLDVMDIVEVSHIDNPSYFGSASSQAEPVMTEDGEEMGDDFMLGDVWRRAKRYRMRILRRIPRYSINGEESSIQFRLLVLDNPNETT